MPQPLETDIVWHDDGHVISVRINKSELEVTGIRCPGLPDSLCADEDYGCLVTHYVNRFGMECNAGVCPASENLEVCWTLIGDRRNLDLAQVWFIPKTDETFAAWLITKKNS